MLYFTYPLNGLLMIGLPIALGFVLARRFGLEWRLFGIGAVTFVASQVVHLPLNVGLTLLFARKMLPTPPVVWNVPFNAVVLGLTAGLCEEGARYVVYRWWIKSARTWRQAIMFGAGHGGMEAILLGVLVAVTFVNMVILRAAGPGALPVPANVRALAEAQVAAYWAASWPMTLLGAVERVSAVCVQVTLAVMVLQVFVRNQWRWLVGAVLWHAAVDAGALLALPQMGPYWTEAVVGIFAVTSLLFLLGMKPAGDTLDKAKGSVPEN